MQAINLLGIDVGSVRIGVARGDSGTRIAYPLLTIPADGNETTRIKQLIAEHDIDTVVVGYPRNQSGEATAQTAVAVRFAEELKKLGISVVLQDESLTSIVAEQQLIVTKKPYQKADIDSKAAALILSDYLESHRG